MTSALYFLWDYAINTDGVRQILREGNETEKAWLIARILTSAKYEDIWKYLKVSDVVAYFPHLRMRPQTKNNWQRALKVWGYEV